MLEAQFIVENALLKDRVRELEARLGACHLILAKNVEQLPAFVAAIRRCGAHYERLIMDLTERTPT